MKILNVIKNLMFVLKKHLEGTLIHFLAAIFTICNFFRLTKGTIDGNSTMERICYYSFLLVSVIYVIFTTVLAVWKTIRHVTTA